MNCTTAQKVWGHPNGFLEGLKAACPGVLEHLSGLVQRLIDGATNPFHDRVARVVGKTCKRYYVEHAEDDDPVAELIRSVVGDAAACAELEHHFSSLHGQTICFANLCCGGCEASLGRLCHKDQLRIQHAAVRTGVNGEEIVL